MGRKFANIRKRRIIQLATTILTAGAACSIGAQDVVPLPEQLFDGDGPESNPVIDLTDRMITTASSLQPEIPDTMTIKNDGGEVSYDSENNILKYSGKGNPVKLLTDEGLDITAAELKADMGGQKASLTGPMRIYQGASLTLAEQGEYDWVNEKMEAQNVRAKVNGILLKGSKIEYLKDDEGKNFMRIHDAYVSTDDSEVPDTWVGAGELTVYPGDYGTITRMSIASGDYDIPIPILGWFSFSHSLNPKEGYMPNLGSKSSWGTFLKNRYGFLLGNRRVEGFKPVADYVLTTHMDYRTRRGVAVGLDLEDDQMQKKYGMMGAIETYFAYDESPMINPTRTPREKTDHERYRIAMAELWDLTSLSQSPDTKWTIGANVNVLSDRYVLRDFFEEISKVEDKPDNTLRLVRTNKQSQTMLFTRFAPNDFYSTDQRAELSYYRIRSAIGNSGITYETRNSAGIMKQQIPAHERAEYLAELDEIKDDETRAYYLRLLNTQPYFRVNSTHEFATTFNIFKFLNITPKLGGGYTGYYGVEGLGADNRFLGFVGLDANIKLHKHYENFSIPAFGSKGLTHVIKPFTTLSHCSISSSNAGVPQIDVWSGAYGTAVGNPMELDLMGFSGIDSWGNWSIWRIGIENIFTTTIDEEKQNLLKWKLFIDYNQDNPHSDNKFSNLYSLFNFSPTHRFSLYVASQTPTIEKGDGYKLLNVGIKFQPFASLDTSMGYRSINDHPIQRDAEQLYLKANLRINEKYTLACQWNWDIEYNRLPIQQYSIFRKSGAWYVGATLFLRDNGGKKETGFGISFTLGETGTALPFNVL